MQVLENEIKGKNLSLRAAGKRGELLIKFPTDVAETLGFEPGQKFEQFYNAQGEVLFRPIRTEVKP